MSEKKPSEIKEIVNIPEGVEVSLDQGILHVKGVKGELNKKLMHPSVKMNLHDKMIEVYCDDSPRRKEKAIVGAFAAHIRNMIKGVTTGYQYTMKTVYSHFPIKVSLEGNILMINNFLGERAPRKAAILDGVKVDIQGDRIILTGVDVDNIGQTAANIERATRVKNRDVRVFQDGIYITSRGE
ncbi:MAG: 50S ribosomal protein L6 [Candidatus Thermoplasmatota archaeon]